MLLTTGRDQYARGWGFCFLTSRRHPDGRDADEESRLGDLVATMVHVMLQAHEAGEGIAAEVPQWCAEEGIRLSFIVVDLYLAAAVSFWKNARHDGRGW